MQRGRGCREVEGAERQKVQRGRRCREVEGAKRQKVQRGGKRWREVKGAARQRVREVQCRGCREVERAEDAGGWVWAVRVCVFSVG